MKNKKGFTLIELLAVCVIISIIATIGVYTITSVINKVRMQALTKTAVMVRKTAQAYLNSNDIIWVNSQIKIDMNPTDGEHKDLLEVSKDPWGKVYSDIYTLAVKDGTNLQLDVYIQTGDNKWWSLEDSSKEITPLPFAFGNLNYSSSSVKVGEELQLLYTTVENYQLSRVEELQILDGSNPLNESYYTWQEDITANELGTLTINKIGNYHIKIKVTGHLEDDDSKTELNSVEFTKDTFIDVINSIEVYDVIMPASPVTNAPVNIKFKVISNLALSSVTGISGPQRNTELTVTKTYTTAGTKNESIEIVDDKGNTLTYNFTPFNVEAACAKTLDCVRYIRWQKSGCYWYDNYEGTDGSSCPITGMQALNTGGTNILNMTTMPLVLFSGGTQITTPSTVTAVKNTITNFTYGFDLNSVAYYEIDLGQEYNLGSLKFKTGWSEDDRGYEQATITLTVYSSGKTNSRVVYSQAYVQNYLPMSIVTVATQ